MWKKDEGQSAQGTTASAPRSEGSRSTSAAPGHAIVGPSITIRGEVTGSEDLVIEGQVDGSVSLDLHSVSVGSEGRVNANIHGRVITIEGTVEGDLIAKEQIVLRGTARVLGDIKAPRVVLEDGATFRGLVDMSAAPASGNSAGPVSDSTGSRAASRDRSESGNADGARSVESSSGTSKGKRSAEPAGRASP